MLDFSVLTGMQSRVLLYVAQLFESSVAIGTFVGFFAGVHPDMLHQLVVAAERLEALLTLMRLHLRSSCKLANLHLHSRLVHEDLQREENGLNLFWPPVFLECFECLCLCIYRLIKNNIQLLLFCF